MTALFRSAALSLTLFGITGGVAFAGCNPSCASDQVCRYEASSGKFYCAPSKSVTGGKAALVDTFGLRVNALKIASPGFNR